MLLSVLISGLGFIPMLVIALLIYAVRRIISNSRSKNQNYQPPMPNQGQQYQQNYTPPPQPGQPGQPNYPQQPYSPPTQGYPQQNYPPPPQGGYQHHQYNTPNPMQPRVNRNTAIPNTYESYTGEIPKKKRNVGLIIGLSIAGIIVIGVAAAVYVAYRHDHGGAGLTSADFTLAYENPTDEEFKIILDDWDTIKVAPHSASTDLAYTHRRSQTSYHWRMLDSNNKLIADTTLTAEAIEEYFLAPGIEEWDYSNRIILLNPSQSKFLFWKVSFGEGAGDDDTTLLQVGDSTYYVSATGTNAAFIFDHRSSAHKVDIEDASRFSDLDFNLYLVSEADFIPLYERIFPGEDHLSKFNKYRNTMIDLYNSARDDLAEQSNPAQSEIDIVNALESLIPESVNDETTARDFVAAIDHIRNEEEFYSSKDVKNCLLILDSSEVILKRTYANDKQHPPFPELHFMDYYIQRNGFFDDEPLRVISSEWDRSTDGKRQF